MNNELIQSAAPHIHSRRTAAGIRADLLIALAPAAVMSVITNGSRCILILLISIVTAMAADILLGITLDKTATSDSTLSRRASIIGSLLEAAANGAVFAMLLPYGIPLWLAAAGAAIAVILFKRIIGLTGRSRLNPAAGAYLIITCILPAVGISGEEMTMSICASTAPALALGFIYLVLRKVIQIRLPLLFVLSFLLAASISSSLGVAEVNPFAIMSGSLILTAVFIAPAYASSPVTPVGKAVFGICGGVLAFLLTARLEFEAALALTVIIMNILSPFIERFTIPNSRRKN